LGQRLRSSPTECGAPDQGVARSFGRATLFIDDAAAVFGYAVELNLFGPAIVPGSSIDFSLTLNNSEFMAGPSSSSNFRSVRRRHPSSRRASPASRCRSASRLACG
jgi:hypothetical protein